MKVVTAPEDIRLALPRPWVFLAGGITDCPGWQWEVIDRLSDDLDGTLFNPRRRNFPMDDPSAAQEQIEWEHVGMWNSDIFTMWFCDSPSDQPICMFELGSQLARIQYERFIPVIGVEHGYSREQDVKIQTELQIGSKADDISSSLDEHISNIADAVMHWRE